MVKKPQSKPYFLISAQMGRFLAYEYRYLYVDASNYILGATNYTTHVSTSPWNVKVKNVHYNAFAIGVQFDL